MKVLLHICCAPCANRPLASLQEQGHDVTGYWYNPNIHPFTEYRARRNTVREYLAEIGVPGNLLGCAYLRTALTLLLEYSHTLKQLTPGEKLLNSFFQSVTLRTAGFASIDQGSLTDASKLLGCLFMFIGASSASTGGGIKTTTAFMMLMLVLKMKEVMKWGLHFR